MKRIVVTTMVLLSVNASANLINKSTNRREFNYSKTILGELNQRQNNFSIITEDQTQKMDLFGSEYNGKLKNRSIKASYSKESYSIVMAGHDGSVEQKSQFINQTTENSGYSASALVDLGDGGSVAIKFGQQETEYSGSIFLFDWGGYRNDLSTTTIGLATMVQMDTYQKVGIEFERERTKWSDSGVIATDAKASLLYGYSRKDFSAEAGVTLIDKYSNLLIESSNYNGKTYLLETLLQKTHKSFDFEISSGRMNNTYDSAYFFIPKVTGYIQDEADKKTQVFYNISRRLQAGETTEFQLQEMQYQVGLGMQEQAGLFEVQYTKYELSQSEFILSANFAIN